jgi:IclR family pca regulon transcriptional regulator
LSCQNDLAMEFMQIRTGTKPFTLNIAPGTLAPLFHSTIGLAAISVKGDQEIAKLIERHNRKVRAPEPKADLGAVLQRVRKIRRAGFGIGYDMYVPSVGAIAWPLPPKVGRRCVVIAIAGPTQRLKDEEGELVRIVRAAIKRYAGR